MLVNIVLGLTDHFIILKLRTGTFISECQGRQQEFAGLFLELLTSMYQPNHGLRLLPLYQNFVGIATQLGNETRSRNQQSDSEIVQKNRHVEQRLAQWADIAFVKSIQIGPRASL